MVSSLKEGKIVFHRPFFDDVLHPRWVNDGDFIGATGFSIDSRSLEEGEIFIALKTGKRDGHEFLEEALRKGAAGALVSDVKPDLDFPQLVVESPLSALQSLGAAWRKEWGGRVIAVTGSCGKTSTKEILGLLFDSEETFITPGNLNNHIGVPLSELLLRSHHKRAILEAGINENGEMRMLGEMLAPEIAVVTTIGPAHLEKLGSLEGVAIEKSQLPLLASEKVFLGPACSDYSAFTEAKFSTPHWILPEARTLVHAPMGEIWRYGMFTSESDGRDRAKEDPSNPCSHRAHDGAGSEGFPYCNHRTVRLHHNSVYSFPTPEATAGMIENMCLALSVALEEGVPVEVALSRLANWKPASKRGEIIEVGGRVVYADHYNANPASFADAVNFFHRRFITAPRIWVIGAMEELGDSSAALHRQLATALPVIEGDLVFLVGGMASEMKSTLARRLGEESVVFSESPEEVAETIRKSQGVIFLKGSRKYRLEKILDSLGETS